MERKLYRDDLRKSIGGVCAGLAEYFNVDVAVVRLIFVLMLILHGTGIVAYVVLWIVLPRKTTTFFNNPTVDYTVPPQTPGADTYQDNPFKGNSFSNNPFAGQPIPNQPFPKQRSGTSLVGIIFGVVLIVVGGSILLDDFDIIPDWDFGQLWPVMLIAVGVALIFAGEKKKPWEQANWHKAETKDSSIPEDKSTSGSADDVKPVDNTPAE